MALQMDNWGYNPNKLSYNPLNWAGLLAHFVEYL